MFPTGCKGVQVRVQSVLVITNFFVAVTLAVNVIGVEGRGPFYPGKLHKGIVMQV